jgi:hypothetical protein
MPRSCSPPIPLLRNGTRFLTLTFFNDGLGCLLCSARYLSYRDLLELYKPNRRTPFNRVTQIRISTRNFGGAVNFIQREGARRTLVVENQRARQKINLRASGLVVAAAQSWFSSARAQLIDCCRWADLAAAVYGIAAARASKIDRGMPASVGFS